MAAHENYPGLLQLAPATPLKLQFYLGMFLLLLTVLTRD